MQRPYPGHAARVLTAAAGRCCSYCSHAAVPPGATTTAPTQRNTQAHTTTTTTQAAANAPTQQVGFAVRRGWVCVGGKGWSDICPCSVEDVLGPVLRWYGLDAREHIDELSVNRGYDITRFMISRTLLGLLPLDDGESYLVQGTGIAHLDNRVRIYLSTYLRVPGDLDGQELL